ncbi:MAG: hypothetical protein ABIR18_05215 [Chitinophagaceae bacterium]
MFINKWLVTDSIEKKRIPGNATGLCLSIPGEVRDTNHLIRSIQTDISTTPFSILLSGNDFKEPKTNEALIEIIITIFFQPCYYMSDYHPVIFLSDKSATVSGFLEQLNEKAKKQGLRDILILEPASWKNTSNSFASFSYWITDITTDYTGLVKKWFEQNLRKSNFGEIHLLVPEKENPALAILDDLRKKEEAISGTEIYVMASVLYEKEKLIEEYRHKLLLKTISEKDMQIYLSVQKEERKTGLNWYYHEYEVLPRWYKQFGHVIKVIMGNRSFKSLFSDSVKKHKD